MGPEQRVRAAALQAAVTSLAYEGTADYRDVLERATLFAFWVSTGEMPSEEQHCDECGGMVSERIAEESAGWGPEGVAAEPVLCQDCAADQAAQIRASAVMQEDRRRRASWQVPLEERLSAAPPAEVAGIFGGRQAQGRCQEIAYTDTSPYSGWGKCSECGRSAGGDHWPGLDARVARLLWTEGWHEPAALRAATSTEILFTSSLTMKDVAAVRVWLRNHPDEPGPAGSEP